MVTKQHLERPTEDRLPDLVLNLRVPTGFVGTASLLALGLFSAVAICKPEGLGLTGTEAQMLANVGSVCFALWIHDR